MLKELFEAHFYGTFHKKDNVPLMLNELTQIGNFGLVDPKACLGCRFVCNVNCNQHVNIINLEQVFSFVKEDVGEVCDYLLDGSNFTILVEMTCSTTEYVQGKRTKARGQLYNALEKLYTCPSVKEHIERKGTRYVIFSWRETFPINSEIDDIEKNMRDMTLLADSVYSPDNESKFDFGFMLREIRYPYVLAC